MKPFLSILLLLSGSAFGQIAAVTKNPNNHQITGNLVMGAGRVLQFDTNSMLTLTGLMRTSASASDGGKVQVNNTGITFGTVDGMLTVQGSDNHAIVARTPNPSDGIAVVGWSIHLQAQQPTANEAAWSALVAAKKTEAATSPEAIAIKDSIMAGATIARNEVFILASIIKANGGDAAYQTAFRTIAGSTKSGAGVSWARACVKFWDGDMSGWTEDVLAARPELPATLATRPGATPQFKTDVWAVFMTRSAHGCRPFFKAYRSTLPKAAQIEATQKQKDLVLAIPTRDAAANAWLAEISADLVALQLDQ